MDPQPSQRSSISTTHPFQPNYRDDMTLTPFQTQQYNAILFASKEDSYKAKQNSLSFYKKDPILQPNESELYVYKPSIRTFTKTVTNPLNVNGGPTQQEIQWKSTLRKIDLPAQPMISSYAKKEMKGLPEKRILKTVQVSVRPNPLVSLDGNPPIERAHFHCLPQPVSLPVQVVWEHRRVLPADRKISPPKHKTYGYLPKEKLLTSYY